jgi:hypothetical protein
VKCLDWALRYTCARLNLLSKQSRLSGHTIENGALTGKQYESVNGV